MVPGNRLTDVSHAIEKGTRAAEQAHSRRYGIVSGYGGHAIGQQMHMEPFLPNEGQPGRGPMLVAGSVLAIEPMLTLGTTRTRILEDDLDRRHHRRIPGRTLGAHCRGDRRSDPDPDGVLIRPGTNA